LQRLSTAFNNRSTGSKVVVLILRSFAILC